MNRIDPQILKMIGELSSKANAYRESILLLTANRAGLFTEISGKTLTSKQIAEVMDWDGRAAEVFLNALTAMGLLNKEEGKFSNAVTADRLLVKGSDHYQGDILNHNLHLWERWSRVGEVLRTGESLRAPDKKRTPEELRAFIDGMSNIARLSAVKLWDEVSLAGRKRLLDVGGGPGTYALEACRRLPHLRALVFDLSEVKPIFEEHRQRSGVKDRASFHIGNVHEDPLPEGCDAALLSNVIHSWSEQQNRALLKKLDEAMPPGSLLILKDFFISEDGTEPLFSALFAVNMLLGTQAGGCYSRSQVESWLAGTAFHPADFILLTEQAGVLVAEKGEE